MVAFIPEDGFGEVIPRGIRAASARFDPRLAHLRNLSAGLGGAAIGLNALPPEDRRGLLQYLNGM